MEECKLNTIQFAQSLFGLEPDTPIAHEFGVLANIQVQDGYFKHLWWGVVNKCTIKNGVAILNAVDYAHNIEYKFTDKSLFDNVSKVVFCIEGKIVEDAEYVDASWSDRTFVFEVDL